MKQRKAIHELRDWKASTHRKPLVIRGARQVGKSTLVRMFGAEFDRFIELNAEKPEVQQLFRDITWPFASYKTSIPKKKPKLPAAHRIDWLIYRTTP